MNFIMLLYKDLVLCLISVACGHGIELIILVIYYNFSLGANACFVLNKLVMLFWYAFTII